MPGELHDLTRAPVLKTAQADVAARGPGSARVVVPPLKDRQRVLEKAAVKGDVKRIADVLRMAVVVPWVTDLPDAVEVIYAVLDRFGWTVDAVHNRLHDGTKSLRYERGFGDVQFSVRDPAGYLAEIRLATYHLWRVSAAEHEHALYRQRRRIVEQAQLQRRALTSRERAAVRALDEQMRELYARAWEQSIAGPDDSGSDAGSDRGAVSVQAAIGLGLVAAGLVAAVLLPGARLGAALVGVVGVAGVAGVATVGAVGAWLDARTRRGRPTAPDPLANSPPRLPVDPAVAPSFENARRSR
jgi:hypothetical protein